MDRNETIRWYLGMKISNWLYILIGFGALVLFWRILVAVVLADYRADLLIGLLLPTAVMLALAATKKKQFTKLFRRSRYAPWKMIFFCMGSAGLVILAIRSFFYI